MNNLMSRNNSPCNPFFSSTRYFCCLRHEYNKILQWNGKVDTEKARRVSITWNNTEWRKESIGTGRKMCHIQTRHFISLMMILSSSELSTLRQQQSERSKKSNWNWWYNRARASSCKAKNRRRLSALGPRHEDEKLQVEIPKLIKQWHSFALPQNPPSRASNCFGFHGKFPFYLHTYTCAVRMTKMMMLKTRALLIPSKKRFRTFPFLEIAAADVYVVIRPNSTASKHRWPSNENRKIWQLATVSWASFILAFILARSCTENMWTTKALFQEKREKLIPRHCTYERFMWADNDMSSSFGASCELGANLHREMNEMIHAVSLAAKKSCRSSTENDG